MSKNIIIKERDIINVYKLEGNLREYENCLNYLKFIKIKDKANILKLSKKLKIKYGTLLHWNKGDRTPYGIKAVKFLKEKKLLPFYPNEKIARIIGFLHGDGYLFNSLTKFGFASSDLNMLREIEKDTRLIFKLKGNIKKFRNAGERVVINNKETKSTKPTYHLECGPKAVCHIIFLLGVPKGKKVYQDYSIPKWIKKGSLENKKAFLQGLFDSELANSKISTYLNHKDNLSCPRMVMGKHIKLEQSLKNYLEEIKNILSEFGINSSIKHPRKYREDRISYNLSISNNLQNIELLIKKIGFYYSDERKNKAKKILKLINQKIINNQKGLFSVIKYCKDNRNFCTDDLNKNIGISKSTSINICNYLYKNGFAKRKRGSNRFFNYRLNTHKIDNLLNNRDKLFSINTGR